MTLDVAFNEGAWLDYDEIYAWIADHSDAETANRYLSRLLDFCDSLSEFPLRGPRREDLMPGIRTIVFENKALVVYQVDGREVRIVRILHKGRDPGSAFRA